MQSGAVTPQPVFRLPQRICFAHQAQSALSTPPYHNHAAAA
ncbi:MAG: hypothetical protein ACFNNL_03580 [Kingella oralis]